ncbi:hypothetical protein [Ornithinibacillus halophilus]|uniref:hypothetical protein n=1 Tax=Ornithinibacillus halophilus TaxID=930117 RepID=UPI001160D867|nr:hypothetical protein [Ornithinibacillus halophilus]
MRISLIVNVLLIVLLTIFVVKVNQVTDQVEVLEQKEQVLYREFVRNQYDLLLILKSIIEEPISPLDVAVALSTNNYNLELLVNNHIDVHNELERFHYNLNPYLYHLVNNLIEGRPENFSVDELKIVIDTLTEYQKELNFNYYDHPQEIRNKINNAVEEVIVPFLESESRPF